MIIFARSGESLSVARIVALAILQIIIEGIYPITINRDPLCPSVQGRMIKLAHRQTVSCVFQLSTELSPLTPFPNTTFFLSI